MLKISILIFFLPFWTCLHSVKITSPPYVELMVSTTTDEVELPCHYTSSSGTNCTINWIKRSAIASPVLQVTQIGIALPAGDYISRVSLRNNASLVLQKPTVADTSNYTCKITNFRDTEVQDSAVIYLFVAVPPTIENSPARKIQFHRDSKIVLSCFGYGLPTPNVSWSKDNHLLDNTRTTLVVQKGDPKDSGQYTCMLSNVVGKVSAVFEVEFCETLHMQNAFLSIITIGSIIVVGGIFTTWPITRLLDREDMTEEAIVVTACIMDCLYLGSLNLIVSLLTECRSLLSGSYSEELITGRVCLIFLILIWGFGIIFLCRDLSCEKLATGRQRRKYMMYLTLVCGLFFLYLFQVCETLRIQNAFLSIITIISIPAVGGIFTLRPIIRLLDRKGMTEKAKAVIACIMVCLYLGSLNLIVSLLMECRSLLFGLYFEELTIGFAFLSFLILASGCNMIVISLGILFVRLDAGRQCLTCLILVCGFVFIFSFQVNLIGVQLGTRYT